MSWSISELRVRLAPFYWFKPSSKIFYRPFQGGTSFVDLLCFCSVLYLLCLCARLFICAFVVTCWERADLLALVCGVQLWVCYFPIGILGQLWYLIVSIPDLYTLTYFCLASKTSDPWNSSFNLHRMCGISTDTSYCVKFHVFVKRLLALLFWYIISYKLAQFVRNSNCAF